MKEKSIGAIGLRWGLIIGVIYCLLLFARYTLGEKNPLIFGVLSFVSYMAVLVLLLVLGFHLRKKMGGYIELKEVFKGLFYAVLVFELMYAIFNFVYVKYINPEFFLNLRNASEEMMQDSKQSQADIDRMLAGIDVDAGQKNDHFRSFEIMVILGGFDRRHLFSDFPNC